MKDPTYDEMREFLKMSGGEGFEIEEAIYWFANDWHGGQSTNLYRALCASEYRPLPGRNGPEDREVYDELVSMFCYPKTKPNDI
jgi:hypothetical protein